MLTVVPNTGGNARRQINLEFTGTSGTILYTVPAGKTCTGHFIGRISSTGTVNINGVVYFLSSGSVTSVVLPVVLVAGTVLRARGTDGNATFIWVEE